MRTSTIVCLIVISGLSACSYRLWVKVDGGLSSPRFAVAVPRLLDANVCFRRIAVTAASMPDEFLWEIESLDDQCAPESEIFYGVVPGGFVEKIPAKPLQADVLYEAIAQSDLTGGQIKFAFLNGQWRTVTP